ncbi:flavin-containing superfamily amine oxidase [Rhizodiscina lignyota]|uniref:Flavin-containing superfamily amine oxidase n=1 Tax=Rhizodiscina lignyota TaxID=1504668 RepID=A0A9P4IRG1_9PEZI|nr:flavin-containing superfamily amine oxidase [Rhizodiscina lignyota]
MNVNCLLLLFHEEKILTRDVCIIGGGSSGTYSAIRLQQLGKSVALIEKEPVLGGHVNTFKDAATGQTFDYGVIVFDNISVVQNYFDHLGVNMKPFDEAGSTPVAKFANFRTGEVLSPSVFAPKGNLTAALLKYGSILDQFPFLSNGYDLPSPIPEDFLLSWGDFLKKHQLGALASVGFEMIEGVGNMLAQRTLYIMKYFAKITVENTLLNGFVTTADNDNHKIYDKALLKLGSSAFVSANVSRIERHDSGVIVAFSTPQGCKLVKASKLLIAIQPKLSSLSFLDTDAEERHLLGQFNNSYYWDAVIRNSGIPDNTSITNADKDAPFGLPPLPGIYGFGPTIIPGLQTAYYSSPHAIDNDKVKSDILATIAKLVKEFGFPPANGTPEFAGFNDHRPFELTVSPDAIRKGFYRTLNGLQGKRSTWWTGATWQAHDSSQIWNWTEHNIIPPLAR